MEATKKIEEKQEFKMQPVILDYYGVGGKQS